MCRGTGFSGQIGVFEVLPLDQDARMHLAKGDLKSAYNAARLKFRAPGIQEAALLRVREGCACGQVMPRWRRGACACTHMDAVTADALAWMARERAGLPRDGLGHGGGA